MCTGEIIGAIAMSEPAAGSDLAGMRTRALRDGDEYVINGQKTFISNGQLADLVITACKTDPEAGARGISLMLVDARIVTLPVMIYNSIRSVITPDLAAVSVVYILIALVAIWLLDRLVGLETFLRSR